MPSLRRELRASGSWAPRYEFDLATGKSKDFMNVVGQYEEWHRAEPVEGPVPLTDGWHDITPELAEQLLRRNHPGANRKLSFATVLYYADQMKRGDWVPTGQPIIFDEEGTGVDLQHRMYAVLFSGITIHTYVVTNVPKHPQLFAFIDNNRPRNAAAALQTAGFNGASPLINSMVKIGESVRKSLYYGEEAAKLQKMAPVDVLRVMPDYPNAEAAARNVKTTWEAANRYLIRSDVVGYLGMKIMDVFGEDMADEFFEDLADDGDRDSPENPIAAFRREYDKDKAKPKKNWPRHVLLANLIKAFNAWRKDEPLRGKRWVLLATEAFPDIEEDEPAAAAA